VCDILHFFYEQDLRANLKILTCVKQINSRYIRIPYIINLTIAVNIAYFIFGYA